MESSKEKAKSLKNIAKQFGYEIKLTHAQEIIAQLNGFKNRHALFNAEDKTKILDPNNITMISDLVDPIKDKFKGSDFEIPTDNKTNIELKEFYYEVHVFYNRKDSSSFFFKSDVILETEEDIINHALVKEIIDSEDSKHVDYTEELTKQEFEFATRKF